MDAEVGEGVEIASEAEGCCEFEAAASCAALSAIIES